MQASAGLRFVDGATPNLEDVKDILKEIAAEGVHAGAVIAGISPFNSRKATTAQASLPRRYCYWASPS